MDFLTKVLGALGTTLALVGMLWLLDRTGPLRWLARWMPSAVKNNPQFFRNWGPLLGVAVALGAMATYLYVNNQPDDEGLAQARISFSRLPLPQAIAHCLALPNDGRHHAPLALAWQPGALDWYVLEGADNASMRHHACDGVIVSTGQRYERVMLDRVAPEGARQAGAALEQNLFDLYAGFSDADVRALEVAEDPQTQRAVERRWLASGDVRLSEAQARELPILLGQVPPGLSMATYPERRPRVPTDWSARPDAVFALLDRHVPPVQRIAQLHFDQTRIQVTVLLPAGVAGQGPPEFGQLSFDAYGVAGHGAWMPVAPAPNTCRQGRTLSELKALFAQQQPLQNMLYAWFDCDPTMTDGEQGQQGSWYLRDVRTRKEHLPPGRQ